MFERLYGWYGKKTVRVIALVLVFLILLASFFFFKTTKNITQTVTAQKQSVTVSSVRNILSSNTFTTVGTVQAVSEARLQTEAGGRITSVTTEIGKKVFAGSVIATIENRAESAQLLQAQGAYEAALAGNRSGESGIEGAQNALISAQTNGIATFQSAFITLDTVFHDNIDSFFTLRNGVAVGFNIDSSGNSSHLNSERTALETVMTQWAQKKTLITKESSLDEVTQAYASVNRIAAFVELLSLVTQDQKISTSFKQEEKDALNGTVTKARVLVNGVQQSLEGARSQIVGAQKAVQQAKLAGAVGTPSLATAQVKIALGTLRGAQANYEKTLVRTSITGVVNALYLKTGEYVSPSQPAAIIANNDGLEILASLSDDDRSQLALGDTVQIDSVATGTITAIASAIDPSTGKVAVKVGIKDGSKLKNGSTVTLTFTQSVQEKNAIQNVAIPLSALKMTGSGPIAFEVVTNKLKALPLVLGEITGDSVVVTSGITLDTVVVVDARGLKEGQEVSVATK